jgi:hypothetical protein
MSGFCDRCNERTSQIINITNLPEMAAAIKLGYRQICAACYEDLLAEFQVEDQSDEPRAQVRLRAQIEGNTSRFEPFCEEVIIEEISPSGLSLSTRYDLDPGAILKVKVLSYEIETTAIVESVWQDAGRRGVKLNLVESGEDWDRLWREQAGPK